MSKSISDFLESDEPWDGGKPWGAEKLSGDESFNKKASEFLDSDEPWEGFKSSDERSRGATGVARDSMLSLISGTNWIPQSVIGMADLVTTPFRAGYEALTGEKQQTFTQSIGNLGFDFAKWNENLSSLKTPQSKAARENVNAAFEEGGIFEGLKTIGKNPMVAIESAIESVPSMLALAGAVRVVAMRIYSTAAKAAPTATLAEEAGRKAVEAAMPRLAALSASLEGAQVAGMSAYEYADKGNLSSREAIGSIGSGVTTAAIGSLSNKIGGKLGLEDVETALGAGTQRPGGFLSRGVRGAIKEGALEEMPQEMAESAWENYVEGNPLSEGAGQAGAEGLVVGALMGFFGGGAAGRRGGRGDDDTGSPDTAGADISRGIFEAPEDGLVEQEAAARRDAADIMGAETLDDAISSANQAVTTSTDAPKDIDPEDPYGIASITGRSADSDFEPVRVTGGAATVDSLVSDALVPAEERGSEAGLQSVMDRADRISAPQERTITMPNGKPFSSERIAKSSVSYRANPSARVVNEEGGGVTIRIPGEGQTEGEWREFSPDTQTLGIPRNEMPQIKAEHRGAMVNFLKGRLIDSEKVEIPAASLKPTQKEFSIDKVKNAFEYEGGDRSILVSSDGYVVDGHHQWIASLDGDVQAIRIDAPIQEILDVIKEFPSAADGTAQAETQHLAKITEFAESANSKKELRKMVSDAFGKRAVNALEGAISTVWNHRNQQERAKVKEDDSLATVVAKLGGINISWREDVAGDTIDNKSVPGVGYVFSKNGTSPDDMAMMLGQYGLITEPESADRDGTPTLSKLLTEELTGGSVRYQPNSMAEERARLKAEEEHYAQLDEQMRAEREQQYEEIKQEHGEEAADLAMLYDDANMLAVDESLSNIEAYERTILEIDDAKQAAEEYAPAIGAPAESAPPEGSERVRQNRGEEAGEFEEAGRPVEEDVESESFDLETQTEESLKERADKEKEDLDRRQKEAQEREDKAQADAEVGSFTLSGSTSQADTGAAAGQSDIFAKGTESDASTQKTSEEPVKWFGRGDRANEWIRKQESPENYRVEKNGRRYEVFETDAPTDSVPKETDEAKGVSARPVLEVQFDGRRYPINRLGEVRDKWNQFIEASGAGASDLNSDAVITKDGELFATISYNGRLWEPGERGETTKEIVLDSDGNEKVEAPAEEAAAAPKETEKKGYGKSNKIFKEDAADKARAILRAKLNNLNIGVDPETMQAGLMLAGYHIEAGARSFSAYSKAMVDDLGEGISPFLRSFYEAVRHYPGFDNEGMSSPGEVESATKAAEKSELQQATDAIKEVAEALKGQSERTKTQPTKAEKGDSDAANDRSGEGALEGVSTEEVRGTDGERQEAPEQSPIQGGRTDVERDGRDGGRGVQQPGSVATTEGKIPPSAAGAGSIGSPRQGGVEGRTPSTDFNITEDFDLGAGGDVKKFNDNIAAITLLKQLESDGDVANKEQQEVLARYVGWGGLSQAFLRADGTTRTGWKGRAAELKSVLSDEEYAAARRSTQDAHYTSKPVVDGIYKALDRLGFKKGKILEPSVGVGNFFGLMPAPMRSGSNLIGVELDTITGGIAKQLYQSASIKSPMGFQKFPLSDGTYDVVIGNPPFGSQPIYDASRKDISKFSIHNYFFGKSLDALREDGILAMVVSKGLMDKVGGKQREYFASKAELLGAIRLPNTAFKANAGTEVTTDIIFLRKLRKGEEADGKWADTAEYTNSSGQSMSINKYFVDNPDMMLGEMVLERGMRSANEPTLTARKGQDIAEDLAKAIDKLPKGIYSQKTTAPRIPGAVKPPSSKDYGDADRARFIKPSGYYYRGDSILTRIPGSSEDGAPVFVEKTTRTDSSGNEKPFNSVQKARIKGMVDIGIVTGQIIEAQVSGGSESDLRAMRKSLNSLYDAYVKKFGLINNTTNKAIMRIDPSWPRISSLESDYHKGVSKAVSKRTGEPESRPSAKKADIFSKRTQQPYTPVSKVSSAEEGLAVSLSEKGVLDIGHIAKISGKSEADVTKELGDLVYEDPVSGWETSEKYLSGNVKEKLGQAIDAAKEDAKYNRNVKALEKVIPKDVPAVDITTKVGSPWLPTKTVEEFINHLAGRDAGVKVFHNKSNAKWSVSPYKSSVKLVEEWGASGLDAVELLMMSANGKTPSVYKSISDGGSTKKVVDREATDAAIQKISEIKEEFSDWIWRDSDRRENLGRLYNDTHNTSAPRDYDGSHLTLPGKVPDSVIKLLPHQKNFVWRVMQGGPTLADHVVGSGKTFATVAAAMELKRTGLASKPAIVVPNHLVQQWAKDFLALYPGANILAATKSDFQKARRKEFFARVATGDWDAIIIAHSSFSLLPGDPEQDARFIEQQIADIEESIATLRESTGESSRTVKQSEKAKESLEAKLEELMDSSKKDSDNLNFPELGIDALFVDEAHEFKNLPYQTSHGRLPGLGNPQGAKKAQDLFAKTQSILSNNGGRNVVFLTGTPISNSMTEMYTMQRYLGYDELKKKGLAHVDSWINMFGEIVSDFELDSTAQGYKLNSRLSKFVNMPELMQMYKSFADSVTRDDINESLKSQGKVLEIPKVKGGGPVNIISPRSAEQDSYMERIVHRAENIPRDKRLDNMLNITTDARKASLDMRLVEPDAPDNPDGKLWEVARNVKRIADKWKADKGAQMVFLDLSMPSGSVSKERSAYNALVEKADAGDEAAATALSKYSNDDLSAMESKFSAYDDLKDKLLDLGFAEHEVQFIHSANTDAQKDELFSKVKAGDVRVLLGSTKKMGAGTNAQERLVALHHVDAPWKPADLEQREGRIIRQGNKLHKKYADFEVEILRYATEKTYDSRMWQTVEIKARFISQVRSGDVDAREVEDISEEAASAAEMKAVSSGNPKILEEFKLRSEISRLAGLKKSHDRKQFSIADGIKKLERRIGYLPGAIDGARKDEKRLTDNPFKKPTKENPTGFSITISGKEHDKRADAGKALIMEIAKFLKSGRPSIDSVGSYRGFSISLDRIGNENVSMTMVGDREHGVDLPALSLMSAPGMATRIQNVVGNIQGAAEALTKRLEEAKRDLEDARKLEGQEFKQEADLAEARKRHADILKELSSTEKKEEKAQEGEVRESFSISDRWGEKPKRKWPFSLFKPKNTTEAQSKKIYSDMYGTIVKPRTVHTIKSAIDTITNEGHIAHLLASLRKDPQENFFAIATGIDGKILRLMRYTRGSKNAAPAYPMDIAAEAASIEGISELHLVHNHPSETTDESRPDVDITNRVFEMLDGTGIKPGFHVIIAGQRYGTVNTALGRVSYTRSGKIAPMLRSKSIPVTERRYTRRDALGERMNTIDDAKRVTAPFDDSIVLINNRLAPVAIVKMSGEEMSQLRKDGRLNRVLSAINTSNATAAIIRTNKESDAANVARMINRSRGSVTVFDWIDDAGNSSLESGRKIEQSEGPFFSSVTSGKKRSARGMTADSVRSAIKGAVEALGSTLDVTVVDSVSDLPEAVRRSAGRGGIIDGAYHEGHAYLVASNIGSAREANVVLAHELVGHKGVIEMLSEEQWGSLKAGIDSLIKKKSATATSISQEVHDRYDARGEDGDVTKPVRGERFYKEFMAVAAERKEASGPVARLVKKLKEMIRSALSSMGFRGPFSETDIDVVLSNAGAYLKGRDSGLSGGGSEAMMSQEAAKGVFYSALLRAVSSDKSSPKNGTSAQWISWLDGQQKRGNIKKGEREWLDVDSWLVERDKTTRGELQDYISKNRLKIKTLVLDNNEAAESLIAQRFGELSESQKDSVPGNTMAGYDDWIITSPDGIRYITASDAATADGAIQDFIAEAGNNDVDIGGLAAQYEEYTLRGGRNYKEVLLVADGDPMIGGKFYSGHYVGNENVIAHIRMNERVSTDGSDVLFIEEIQSDLGQEGRSAGYATRSVADQISRDQYGVDYKDLEKSSVEKTSVDNEIKDRGLVPSSPFKGTPEWTTLALKRVARYAVENGFDRIAWTTGDQQADRYDISQKISRITYSSSKVLRAYDQHERLVVNKKLKDDRDIANYVGKEVAKTLLDSPVDEVKGTGVVGRGPKGFELEGVDLKVGGEGMRGFYDNILPSSISKWAKKFGAKVGHSDIDLGGYIVSMDNHDPAYRLQHEDSSLVISRHKTAEEAWAEAERLGTSRQQSIEITPQMEDAVLSGQPMFSVEPGGDGAAAEVGSGDFSTEEDSILFSTKRNPNGKFSLKGKSEFSKEQVRLREEDKSLWDKAKKLLRRQLSPGGLLPDSVFDRKIQRDGKFGVVELTVQELVREFELSIKADFGVSVRDLGEGDMKALSEALAGRMPANMKRRSKVAILSMRQYIDDMSGKYVDILMDQINEMSRDLSAEEIVLLNDIMESEGDLLGEGIQVSARVATIAQKAMLMQTIISRVGEYVHRSYQVFDDPEWFKKIPKDAYDDAMGYLVDRYMEDGIMDEDEAAQNAERTIDNIIKNDTAYDSIEAFIVESKLGAKDLSVLKRRKNIAPEIRALMGEYVDPRVNFAKSATKMGRLVFNQVFLDRVREDGMGVFLFNEDDRPTGTVMIAGNASDAYSPLNGLWTYRDVNTALKDSLSKEQMAGWYRFVVRMNGFIKGGKTILSPTTSARNFQSAMFFAIANGHFDMREAKKSLSLIRKFSSPEKLAYVKKMIDLGVIYDNPYAEEMMDLLKESRFDSLFSDNKVSEGIRASWDFARDVYSFGDDFWKVIGFENEKAKLIKHAGMSEAEAGVEAANRVRNMYPTYSMVGKSIQWLRRFPLSGTFVSFPSEVVRTSFNIVKTIASDWKTPGMRRIAVDRLIGASIAASFAAAAQEIAKAALGFDDEDEESIRLQAAPWQKNSNIVITGLDPDGNIKYFDISFLDPYNYFKRPINAIMRDQPIEDALISGAADMLSPFFGTDIAAGAIMEIYANKKESGGQVFKEADAAIDQLFDIADHLRKAVQPGFVSNLERTWKALKGERSPSGRKYDMGDEGLSWIGWRASTLDPKTALFYRSFEFRDAKSDATRTMSEVLNSPNKIGKREMVKAMERSEKIRVKAYDELITIINATKRSGMSRKEIIRVLRVSGTSQRDIAAMINGRIPQYIPSEQSQAAAFRRAMELIGEEEALRIRDRYREARRME